MLLPLPLAFDFSKLEQITLGPLGTLRYMCTNCDKVYTHKESLIRHRRFECGKIPQFECPHCPHRSAQRCNLTRHMKRFHGLTRDKSGQVHMTFIEGENH